MTTEERLLQLVARWRKDADQYKRQVEEARAKDLPHTHMLSSAQNLRQCAKEVEVAIEPTHHEHHG